MSSVIIRQQYEFAAAHRLHTPELSDAENRKLFGKCNNPSGHGHNYRISVAVRTEVQPNGHVTPVEDLDALINETVIQPLDHQHLNLDVPQFTGEVDQAILVLLQGVPQRDGTHIVSTNPSQPFDGLKDIPDLGTPGR